VCGKNWTLQGHAGSSILGVFTDTIGHGYNGILKVSVLHSLASFPLSYVIPSLNDVIKRIGIKPSTERVIKLGCPSTFFNLLSLKQSLNIGVPQVSSFQTSSTAFSSTDATTGGTRSSLPWVIDLGSS
jgi:hypothetical protein